MILEDVMHDPYPGTIETEDDFLEYLKWDWAAHHDTIETFAEYLIREEWVELDYEIVVDAQIEFEIK